MAQPPILNMRQKTVYWNILMCNHKLDLKQFQIVAAFNDFTHTRHMRESVSWAAYIHLPLPPINPHQINVSHDIHITYNLLLFVFYHFAYIERNFFSLFHFNCIQTYTYTRKGTKVILMIKLHLFFFIYSIL